MAKHPDEIVGDVAVALLKTAADCVIDSIFLLRPTLKRRGLERRLNSYFGGWKSPSISAFRKLT